MKEKHLDLVRMVLDHQLLDSNYVECGKVDDVELAGGVGELTVRALLTGPGVAVGRLPGFLQSLARRLFGARATRVPWGEVQVITSHIKLNSHATDLGLAGAENKVAAWLKKLPMSE
jgi:hypothetical protein